MIQPPLKIHKKALDFFSMKLHIIVNLIKYIPVANDSIVQKWFLIIISLEDQIPQVMT